MQQMDHGDHKLACFQFTCRDGPLVVDVDPLKDLFPPISPVGILLSDRWPAAAAIDHRIELHCQPYSTHTIRLVLEALQSRDQSLTEIALQLWQCRHEFVSACDFLLLAGTTAGRLAADLLAISAHAVIDIRHDLSEGGHSPGCSPMARITTSIAPHAAHTPFTRGALCGINGVFCPTNMWTNMTAKDVAVTSLADLVDAARVEASQWSIMSPRDFSRATAGTWSPTDFYTVDDDDSAGSTTDEETKQDDEGGVAVFRRPGACSSTVVVGLEDIRFLDPADAIAQGDRRDPVCALPRWAPLHPYRRGYPRRRGMAILVAGGTPEGRMQTASAMARMMQHPKIVVHRRGFGDPDLSCFGDALVVDDPPVEPDRKTLIVVPEIFRGDERQLLALDNVHQRHCSAIITTNSPTGKGIRFQAYRVVCVLIHPYTERWALGRLVWILPR
ncbi:hypothetical protein pclt_cds_719 [Pandoravirus celtis]|uniref:Uncharacterized protein n=1 Tax=Pandoravirus celtis TaxID=2568002 RepID=A0A4D6EHL8_9VIRU|nr:hypothetical protein pclt_cds_719 [Pandoravirus celtis]